MANFKISYGLQDNLPAYSSALEGTILITTDERAAYANIGGSQFRLGDFQIVAQISDLPAAATAGTRLFFVRENNALAVSNGTEWVQVNPDTDTGATSIEIVGTGTAGAVVAGDTVSSASYDSSTRKITLTCTNLNLADVATSGDADDVAYGSSSVKDELDKIEGDDTTTGSIAKAAKDALDTAKGYTDSEIADLDTASDVTVASVSAGVVTLTAGVAEVDGIIQKGSGSDITLAKAATTGAAGDISINAISGVTGSNAQSALESLKNLIDGVDTAGKVTVEQPVTTDYAKVYSFYQGVTNTDTPEQKAAKKIVDVNIPKDMVVSGAEVKTVTTADDPYVGAKVGDKYIDITIANASQSHIYVPCKDLVDVYTGSVGAEVTVTVGNDNVISSTINKINANKIVYKEASQGSFEVGLKDYLGYIPQDASSDDIVDYIHEVVDAAVPADATVSQTAGADGLALSVTTVDGTVTAVSGSIAANTYDAHGAASAVLGTASDTSTDNTVYGVKALANEKAASTYVGEIPSTATATTVVGYVDEAVDAATTWGTF